MQPELHWLPTSRHDPADPTPHHLTAIQRLAAMRPKRQLTAHDAAIVAERQAHRLLHLRGATRAPIPDEVITGLYQIEVRHEPRLPVAGYAHWAHDTFLIHVNARDHPREQRLTIAHEFKHIIDHALDNNGSPPAGRVTDSEIDERVAEYFARCLLMPKSLVAQYYGNGLHTARQLSEIFAVPEYAARCRLFELGLTDERPARNRSRLCRSMVSALWNGRRTLPY